MAARNALVAFNRQVRQLPADLQARECGLIEIGRQHARNFDAGHSPSGGGVQRVLAELRKLADSKSAPRTTEMPGSELDAIRAKRAARIAGSSDRERPAVGDQRGG